MHEAAQLSITSKVPFFPQWAGHRFYKSEHKISKETRLDGVFFENETDLIDPKSKKHFIEIKNTTLMTTVGNEKHAQFPDAVTERGQKHLIEMMKLIDEGHRSELIFTIQRNDVDYFSVADHIDSRYAELFQKALKKGLIVTPVLVDFDQHKTELSRKVLKIK